MVDRSQVSPTEYDMSRWEKLTLAACLILLLVGIIHLYRQLTLSRKSQHLFLQPPILAAAVEDDKSDYHEEKKSSLILSDTSITAVVQTEPSKNTTSETSTSVKSASATKSTFVVFYNR